MLENEKSQLIADVGEQVLFLQELGVDAFDVDLSENISSELRVDSSVFRTVAAPVVQETSKKEIVSKPRSSRLAALPSLVKRAALSSPPAPAALARPEARAQTDERGRAEEQALIDISPQLAPTTDTIETIRAEIGDCTRCPLYTGRTQIVHTTGNFRADLMFIGEAPGADEDAKGFPFVGRAGQLLTKIIESIGYKRADVAIGNINRCRPPGNRAPSLDEAHICKPFLLREIAVIRPKVIVVLGNTALHNLLDTKVGITKARGTFQDYFGVKVMPTFHPAYLLRDPHKKREAWEDMKKVRDYLAEG